MFSKNIGYSFLWFFLYISWESFVHQLLAYCVHNEFALSGHENLNVAMRLIKRMHCCSKRLVTVFRMFHSLHFKQRRKKIKRSSNKSCSVYCFKITGFGINIKSIWGPSKVSYLLYFTFLPFIFTLFVNSYIT